MTARPTTKREQDYDFRYSFHLVILVSKRILPSSNSTRIPIRKCNRVFKKLLRHRKPCFHEALFNLIVENLTMKDTIFKQTQVQCNMKSTENMAMGKSTGPCQPINSKRQFKIVGKPQDPIFRFTRASIFTIDKVNMRKTTAF
jgi:hypothetical protein